MDESGAFAWIIKGVREARSAMNESFSDTSAWIVTGTLAPLAILYLLWNREAVETIDDGGIDVDALLEDTPEAAEERKRKEQYVGLPARQLLNALQKWIDNDHGSHEARIRRRAYNLMVKVSTVSDEFPQALFIRNVKFGSTSTDRGGFASVFKGTYCTEAVAVKQLHLGPASVKERNIVHKRFFREALAWRQLQHLNILPFRGVHQQLVPKTQDTHLCMVSPWVDKGNIMSYVRSDEYNPHTERMHLLIGVAQALEYIHEQKIYHGDLHWGNVLVSHEGHALLADFGLVVVGDISKSALPATSNFAGAMQWLAPELVDAEGDPVRKSAAGDIFAFGRLCLVICTKSQPFPGKKDLAAFFQVREGLKPTRPDPPPDPLDCPMPNALWNLAMDCWKLVSEGTRPTAVEALERLKT